MKRSLAFGGVVATAGLLAAGLAAPAQAAGDTVADAPLAATGIAAQNIAALWLAEGAANLESAKPYNIETPLKSKHTSVSSPAGDDKPGIVPAIGDEKKSSTGTSKNVNLPRTVGKVFFADKIQWVRGKQGRLYPKAINAHWCSATSVQSTYRNLVATAGHCAYDTKNAKSNLNYWVFVPGYYKGKTPFGIYVGKQAFTHYDYDVYEDGDRDYAFVTVYNGLKMPIGGIKDISEMVKAGKWDELQQYAAYKEVDKATYDAYVKAGFYKEYVGYYTVPAKHSKDQKDHYYVLKFADAGRLGDNVGGQGIAYNQKLGANVFVFGYPSGAHPDGTRAFTGLTAKWSYGKTFAAQAPAIKAEELMGVKSSFTGEGSSGSAWLLQYKSAKRVGYLNGVTIGISDRDGNKRIDTSLSPYFDGETYGVYKAAAAVWSGSIA
ncbi:trypsin-like serine peptidase [Sphaerimonospora mesophila]|uniref:trypsin-like serine peptidase n=1 Tax=Sphaerimonospora mesophila TaxID=37483 RepID=UPI0006E34A86